jgi:hypothetical protein
MTMTNEHKVIKVAVVQAAPVLFDREATIDKANQLITEAGKKPQPRRSRYLAKVLGKRGGSSEHGHGGFGCCCPRSGRIFGNRRY